MERLKEELAAKFKQSIENKNTEFVDLEIKGSSRNPVIRVFVDEAGGIAIEKCAAISRELNHLIEAEDIIKTPYRIDVSSPGLDRPLKTARDFARNVGRLVKIAYRYDEEDREISGEISHAESEQVVIEYDHSLFEIPYDQIDSALIQIKWK